ncbi:DUF192 domain-containing protein [Kamptonema cortianum]|uniref:DUF192 domain-containing protein n=1 Tax=Geitlerinema calcuttense NRMC-F 0142 TaxID=2922238 RepID=A0ABT7LX22_9CYAN|nr:DUF192 domain-containing protein [Geitlerinema calcuttense]MDI9634330.1 DUF192 domain-containing protein [Geitlerinema splendidum]MDK3162072.1 DUF192 domain-containing protein [Kamptonema cortianum]MDL5047571.1 DUF192 domain-containing protein [Oscillatoria amoena NRMC-F 0135]MDL5056558.1 DUF192 domain-containing protein [Geitlerinema calcuttense NRMC-F 0142]
MKYSATFLLAGISACLLGCSIPSATSTSPDAIAQLPMVQESRAQNLPILAEATIKGELFELEVPQTPEEQALGLMYRPALPDNRGMLFPFHPPRVVGFWMKNVPVPLDMVFIREETVVEIADSVPPCTSEPCAVYGPSVPVDRVLELRAGRAAELGLQVGDRISVRFLNAEADDLRNVKK